MTLLNIKPILQIHGGKLDAFAKVMSMKQAKSKMIAATKKEIEERFPEEAKQGKVYIGMAHSNPNADAQELKDFEAEGEIFYLGDNRIESADSRTFGTCTTEQVVGVVENWSILFKNWFNK